MRYTRFCHSVVGTAWLITLTQALSVQASNVTDEGGASPMELICLTDRPVVDEGASTGLRAWVTTAAEMPIGQSIMFEWEVTEGRVQGNGAEVRWDLAEVAIAPGELHKKVVATARAMAQSHGATRCVVEVFIGKIEITAPGPPIRGGLIPARRFLLPNETEEAGYGLYSYLLFSTPPLNEEERARYLKAIESCLVAMQDIEEYLKRHLRPSQLNATHVPVTKMPKFSESPAVWAQNVLNVYDYASAQVLLNKLDKVYQGGPYLMSVLKPLSDGSTVVALHLVQDLAGVVPDLASNWVRLFIDLTAQQRSWTDQSLRHFGFTLRNLIAVAGKVTPDIARALTTMIQFR